MKTSIALALLWLTSCAGSGKTVRNCVPFEKDGKQYDLCEKEPGTAAATPSEPAQKVDPSKAEPPTPSRDEELERARKDRDDAVTAAKEAADKVELLERVAADMIQQINSAIAAVQSAQSDADRASATARLKKLQQDQAEMQRQIAEAKAKAEKAARQRGVKVSKECQDNPLAKGCY